MHSYQTSAIPKEQGVFATSDINLMAFVAFDKTKQCTECPHPQQSYIVLLASEMGNDKLR